VQDASGVDLLQYIVHNNQPPAHGSSSQPRLAILSAWVPMKGGVLGIRRFGLILCRMLPVWIYYNISYTTINLQLMAPGDPHQQQQWIQSSFFSTMPVNNNDMFSSQLPSPPFPPFINLPPWKKCLHSELKDLGLRVQT